MIIQVHRANGSNLKFFLDNLGFASVWSPVNEDWDELHVFPDTREDLIKDVHDELERTNFLPYHYLLSPENKGGPVQGTEVKFKAAPTQIVTLKNISGDFRLILFEDGKHNYVWKTYSQRELEPREYEVSGKVTCQLSGRNGENFCLINLPRFK